MDKLIESLGKLIQLLGKIIKAMFSSNIFWLIVVAVAIFSLAVLSFQIFDRDSLSWFWTRLAALVSIALILAKVIIWVIGIIRDQFFA